MASIRCNLMLGLMVRNEFYEFLICLGVTLYEIFSLGKIPYAFMSNEDVIAKLETGYRLPQPDMCPDVVYKLMLEMWNIKPKGIALLSHY
jgi:hypothetical protein